MTRITKGDNKITKKYSLIHKGVDLGFLKGNNDYVISHSSGVVVEVVTGKKNDTNTTGTATYGNYVKILHNNGYFTLYAHLEKVYVKVGEKVKESQVIGYMGNSGKSYGKHLHFEVRNKNDKRINPTNYVNGDLPNDKIKYQVYDLKKKKWLPTVIVNTNSYAGNKGNAIGALYIDSLTYRVHDLNKNKWLPYVTGRNDYAGNKKAIDGVQIKNAKYRVHLKGGKWLKWISKIDNTSSGYAGIYGREIDAIKIKFIEK